MMLIFSELLQIDGFPGTVVGCGLRFRRHTPATRCSSAMSGGVFIHQTGNSRPKPLQALHRVRLMVTTVNAITSDGGGENVKSSGTRRLADKIAQTKGGISLAALLHAYAPADNTGIPTRRPADGDPTGDKKRKNRWKNENIATASNCHLEDVSARHHVRRESGTARRPPR